MSTSPEPVTPEIKNEWDESPSPQKRSADDDEHPESPPPKKPKTPRKKTETADKPPKTPKTPKTPKEPKTPKSGKAGAAGIPLSWDEAGEADRMLITMKDEGKPMKEIKATYEKMTGKIVGASTLPNRIARLKANFARLDDGDDAKLMDALDVWELEYAEKMKLFEAEKAKFEGTKWARLAELMVANGAQKYSSTLLQKELKKVQDALAAGTWVRPEKEAVEEGGAADGEGEEDAEMDGVDGADVKDEPEDDVDDVDEMDAA